jgi:hypothetical protein
MYYTIKAEKLMYKYRKKFVKVPMVSQPLRDDKKCLMPNYFR